MLFIIFIIAFLYGNSGIDLMLFDSPMTDLSSPTNTSADSSTITQTAASSVTIDIQFLPVAHVANNKNIKHYNILLIVILELDAIFMSYNNIFELTVFF